MTFELQTLAQTTQFGRILGELAQPGDVICLEGDLGAGKTTLTQAVADGLGVAAESYVTSPSFAILHEYMGRLPLYHFDFYRLGDSVEVEEQGFADYFFMEGLCVIEWPALARDLLPLLHLRIRLTLVPQISPGDPPASEGPAAADHPPRRVELTGSLQLDGFTSLLADRLKTAGIL